MAQSRNTAFAPAPPPMGLLLLEPMRAILELCAWHVSSPPKARGDGHSVLVFPGLGAGPMTTARMRRVLTNCGFDAHDWGLGINTGPKGEIDEWLACLDGKLDALYKQSGRRVSLVGWSLGGIYARELAKHSPSKVRQVVTMGTPFRAMTGCTHAEEAYKLLNGAPPIMTPSLQRRLRQRPSVPTTAIYSRTDGMVAWQACMEKLTPLSESIHVPSASHMGMGTHPEILRVLVDRLSQPEGKWRHYRREARPQRMAPPAYA